MALSGCENPTQSSNRPILLSEVMATGLPVVFIDTEAAQPILSKEEYVSMNMRIVSDNPDYCLEKTGFKDGIRGRGNATWTYPKKPYRIKFDAKTALFGLERAKSWVLLADYRSPTLLQNVIAFELGRLFGLPYTNHYQHVELVLNGIYEGTYILTEQVQVGKGRVDINKDNGFLIELDFHYDEEPKFKTHLYQLPILIKSPEDLENISGYDFVKASVNNLESAIKTENFTDGEYKDLIDVDTLIDYLIINDILMNFELQMPASVYMYQDAGAKIKMGPLWDFDCGYGYEDNSVTFFREYTGRIPNFPRRNGNVGQAFFQRFFQDPDFVAQYKARWNEKYNEIASITVFIDTIYNQLHLSLSLNSRRWYDELSYKIETHKLRAWWNNRTTWLHSAINAE